MCNINAILTKTNRKVSLFDAVIRYKCATGLLLRKKRVHLLNIFDTEQNKNIKRETVTCIVSFRIKTELLVHLDNDNNNNNNNNNNSNNSNNDNSSKETNSNNEDISGLLIPRACDTLTADASCYDYRSGNGTGYHGNSNTGYHGNSNTGYHGNGITGYHNNDTSVVAGNDYLVGNDTRRATNDENDCQFAVDDINNSDGTVPAALPLSTLDHRHNNKYCTGTGVPVTSGCTTTHTGSGIIDTTNTSGTTTINNNNNSFRSSKDNIPSQQQLSNNNNNNNNNNNKVFIIAATNCPWDIDPAFLRRFQKRCYVPLPRA